MLSENIKARRQELHLSQQELADRLCVVRQTVSKWEKGLSVPDSDLLVALSEVLELPVSTLVDEDAQPLSSRPYAIEELVERIDKFEQDREKRITRRRNMLCATLAAASVLIAIVFIVICCTGSFYLAWDFSDPETAVAGTILHGMEWLFIRIAPVLMPACLIGAMALKKRKQNTAVQVSSEDDCSLSC